MGQGQKIFDKNINKTNPGSNAQSNPITPKKTANRLYGGYKYSQKPYDFHNNAEPLQVLIDFCASINSKKSVDEIINHTHITAISKLGCNFTAVGLVNSQLNYLNIKLSDHIGNIYSSRILLSETQNPIVNSFLNKARIGLDNVNFLDVPYLRATAGTVFPLTYQDECIGTFIAGFNIKNQQNDDLLNVLANYLGLSIMNQQLNEKVNQDVNVDRLTGLNNHRDFQEKLCQEIKNAENDKKPVSIIILDIHNISQINREYGHAKGDEIICLVADKIKQNIRPEDMAGRYGGDEMAIMLHDTDNEKACKIAEYLNYTISSNPVDDVGPVRVNIGISSYPTCTKDQEKLLLLAEQAMLISKSKGYQNGSTSIVSAQNIDFWNEMALDSLANVIAKRHSQWGINYEDELVRKFHSENLSSNSHVIDVVTSLAGAIDAKDPYTNGHSHSVSRYAEALARALNLPDAEVERIKLGAMLHDVGKIGIPGNILRKPEPLDNEEWEIMKQHPQIGVSKVLEPLSSLKDLIPMIKHHHENWNGSGYPDKLAGEAIPLKARIVAVADAFHALISDRPYRKALSVDKAVEILRAGAGIQWDKDIVRQFIIIAPSLCTKV